MGQTKSTQKSLIMSVMAVLLCCAMLTSFQTLEMVEGKFELPLFPQL